MNMFESTSLDPQAFFASPSPDDDKRLQEWLDLDQAGDDVGLPARLPQPFLRAEDQDPDEFLFERAGFQAAFSPDHSILNKLLCPHLDSHMSLDPSVIMGSAHSPYSATIQPATNPAALSAPLSLPSLSPAAPVPSSSGRPAYPLDPLLASATIEPSTRPAANKPLPLSQFRQPVSPKEEIDDNFMLSPTRSISSPIELCAESSNNATHKRTHSHPHALVDVPDWEDKPSAEEYKLLSSKEKRQLRNKISARNFRHRRKEHISTLEQQVINRDKIIDSLRHELGQARSENTELKSEIDLLKLKWSDLMKKIEEMSLGASSSSSPQPASIPIPLSPRSRSVNKTGSLILQMPNLHKDVGTHSRKPFNGVGGMTGGGNVGVHTTLIPEMPIDVYRNPVVPPKSSRAIPISESFSPQALLEQKLLTGPNPTSHTLNLFKSLTTSTPINNKISNRDECTHLTAEDLSMRLSQIVAQAFTTNMVLDEEKLLGCLEGRLELQVVECAPPPYLSTTPIDLLSRQFSRIGIDITPAAPA